MRDREGSLGHLAVALSMVVPLLGLAVQKAGGGPIVQDSFHTSARFSIVPAGQSFTAEDPHVIVGFGLEDWGSSSIPPGSLTFRLRAGEGSTGELLATDIVAGVPAKREGYVYADLTSADLASGAMYSALVEGSDISRWARRFYSAQGEDKYPGGHMLTGTAPPPPWDDMEFRVLPIPNRPARTVSYPHPFMQSVVNGEFEAGGGSLGGWSEMGLVGAYQAGSNCYAYLFGPKDNFTPSQLSQTVDIPLAATDLGFVYRGSGSLTCHLGSQAWSIPSGDWSAFTIPVPESLKGAHGVDLSFAVQPSSTFDVAYLYLDSVGIVPEPVSLVLLAMGAMAFLARRK
jgi:hypothetical protein